MENLADILKQLRDTHRGENGGSTLPEDTLDQLDSEEEAPCPICKGRLWLRVDVPVGHASYGEMKPCPCQVEVAVSERDSRLRRYSNLGPLSRLTFATLNPRGRTSDEESRRMFGFALQSARAYADEPDGWLVLTGPNGSGKTHLAAAVANRCIELGKPVFFVHVPDLLDDLRSTYAPMSQLSYSELFEQVIEAPLLVLDGLGAQSPTPWAQEKLQQIFNRRANSQLPTVVTSAAAIQDIDPYISSRMTNPDLGLVLEIQRRQSSPSGDLGRLSPEMARNMTFQKFDTRGSRLTMHQKESLRMAFETATNYATDPDGWLTMFGGTGTGKTHLAVAIAVHRLERGEQAFFAFVPELVDHLRYTFGPNSSVTYDHVFDSIRNAPLLILDDLGSEQRSEWAREKLYQLVVHRHNRRMPTIVTTAVNIPEDTSSIVSRLRDPAAGVVVNIDAPDHRTSGGRR